MKPHRVGIPALVLCLVLSVLPAGGKTEDPQAAFSAWLEHLKRDALKSGISNPTLEKTLAGIEAPLSEILALDRSQPEFTQTLDDYIASRINDRRIRNGRRMLQRYPTWLGRVERKYGVQRRFIVALWGIETGYGENTGKFPVLEPLATLAFDGRRSDYFRQELIEALHLIEEGTVPFQRMRGSWAGAMGQSQFMPSVYRRYAVDEDRSGSTNLWGSIPDVLGSTANYLAKLGWKNDQTWGRRVRLPAGFDSTLAGLETRLPLSRWQALGVRRDDGRNLPRRDLEASLIRPMGEQGPAFLVYDNYRVILHWNRSHLFAIAVGTLADRLAARHPEG